VTYLLTIFTMALSECIDDDSFDSAHRTALQMTPEQDLDVEFIPNLTRQLINELFRAGVDDVKNDRERSSLKIRQALESIRRYKASQWFVFLRNKIALRMALEHELASRTTFSEMPPSIKRLTQKISVPPPANNPEFNEFPTKRSGIIPPADDPRGLKDR